MKQRPPAVPGPGRYTVDAVAKALELLSTFSFHDRRLRLSALAARTGVPRDGISLAVHARGRTLRHQGGGECDAALPAHGGLR
jgi:hypothetical protein